MMLFFRLCFTTSTNKNYKAMVDRRLIITIEYNFSERFITEENDGFAIQIKKKKLKNVINY